METMMKPPKTIELSDIRATALHFASPHSPKHRYVVEVEPVDYLDFLKKYNSGDVEHKRADGIGLDESRGDFYLVYVADCMDPPCVIVRADSPSDAEERFASETDLAVIEEEDFADYDEDNLHYDDRGRPYDSEAIQVYEVKLVHIELA